jgi:hypothetical protein
MSPARLSNYGPGRGPRVRPVGWPDTARNSNNTDLFGLRPGRAGQPECINTRKYTYFPSGKLRQKSGLGLPTAVFIKLVKTTVINTTKRTPGGFI